MQRTDAVLVAPGLGPSLRAVIDLSPPDARQHERFETELGELFHLLFERWCPARPPTPIAAPWLPSGSGDSAEVALLPPLADARDIAAGVARGWTEVWFPPGDRPAAVEPLLSHPWVAVEAGYWPFDIARLDGTLAEVAEWPPDDARRPERTCWIRAMSAPVQLVELRVRPDRARAGRVRVEVQLNVDVYDATAPAAAATADAARRHAEHSLVLAAHWEDLICLYAPVHHAVEPGEGGRLLAAFEPHAGEMAERVAARIHQRIEAALSGEAGASLRRALGVYAHWLDIIDARAGNTPAGANAREALRRAMQGGD